MKKLLVLFLALVMCFGLLVACKPEEPETPEITYKLDKAVQYVSNMYKGEQVKPEGSDTACATKYADFERVSQVVIAGVAYDVVWTVDETDETKVKVIQGSGATPTKIDVNERTTEDFDFTLTATVKAGDGTSDTLTFNFFTPAYNPITYDEYRAKKDGESATVEGIVVALNSKSAGNKRNHIFAVDASGKGGYYAYDMEDDPVKLGIEVGMTVGISGEVDIYQGMYELKNATPRIIDTNKQSTSAIDVSAKFGAGEDILEYVGALITIKGVTIGGQELDVANSQYLFFSLNGVESYIRTYVTDLPTSFDIVTNDDSTTSCADKAVIDAAHAAKRDWIADVTGVLIAYNGTPYLMPVSADCFNYIEFAGKTDEEKINFELDALEMVEKLGQDKTVDVATAGADYTEVVLSWASDSEYAVVAADGKSIAFTIPETETTVTITVTATIGETSNTKTFDVTLVPVKTGYTANTPYYFGFTDKDGVKKYLDGTNSINNKTGEPVEYRWNLTDDVTKATEFFVEIVDGGYYVYFMKDGAKTYLNIVKNGNYTNLLAATEGKSVWTYDVALEALVVDVDGTVFVPKNYKGYGNVEAKKSDYTDGDTYSLGLMAVEFNIGYENNGEMKYLDGTTVSGFNFRWNLTADKALAATFYLEGNADGTYYVYFYVGETKTYLNIVKNGDYINLLAGETAESKWAYNEELKAYAVDIDGTLYVPKTYNNYGNVEAKKSDYIKGETFTLSLYNTSYAPAAPETPDPEQPGEGGGDVGGGDVDPNAITASKTIAELITANGWTSSTTKQSFNLDDNVTVKVDGGSNSGKAYNGDHIRIYATDTPAGTLTITVPEGYELVSIKVTTLTGTYAFLYVDGTTTDISNVETAVSGNSVLLNTVKNGSDGKQVRVTAIEVVYKPVAE
ncbi:MAG: hypothetical protein IKA64_01495 [Clostridia bacterium]|nr:hypothetical protein [Clostridia bacterium]